MYVVRGDWNSEGVDLLKDLSKFDGSDKSSVAFCIAHLPIRRLHK